MFFLFIFIFEVLLLKAKYSLGDLVGPAAKSLRLRSHAIYVCRQLILLNLVFNSPNILFQT